MLVPGTAPAAPGEAPEQAAGCHRRDSGWELISVRAGAVDAHVRHGDAAPGDPVPGAGGQTLDETCTPQARPAEALDVIGARLDPVTRRPAAHAVSIGRLAVSLFG